MHNYQASTGLNLKENV